MEFPDDAPEEWRLLGCVHPFFACKLFSVDNVDSNEWTRETILNLQTLFDFEIWLVPDALQEALILQRTKNVCPEGIAALVSLLQLFEDSLGDGILKHHPGLEKQRLPKLRALQHKLNRGLLSSSSAFVDHCHGNSSTLLAPPTLERLINIVTALENFNQTVNRVSSSTKEDDSAPEISHSWKLEEIMAVRKSGKVRNIMNAVLHGFVKELKHCGLPHIAMVHLSDPCNLKMLLSSCTNQRVWRQVMCRSTDDQVRAHGPELALSMREQSDLCAAIRGPPHKLLQISFNDSMIWHNSNETVPIVKDAARIPLLQLLEGRTYTKSSFPTVPHLSKKKKKVVVVILANFLMILLGSGWLQRHWTSENIFFVPDLKPSETDFLEIPYILSLLGSPVEGDTAIDIESNYSYIYAFGILILELELDQSIPITAEDEDGADEEYPAVYMALVRVFQLRKEDLDDPYVLQVINSCLDFVNKVDSIKHPSFNNEVKFDAAVLRFILEPLIQRLQAAHPEVSLNLLGAPISTIAHALSSRESRVASSRPSGQDTASVNNHVIAFPTSMATDRSRKRLSSSLVSAVDPTQPRHRRDFKIAIICALPLEADAVLAMFDKRWDEHSNPFGKAPGDPNAYSTGRIGQHNVVLVHMPGIGKENAASAAANCRSSFGAIELAVVVGICGGVPFLQNGEEVLLGDVVISEGIISYDFGRQYPDKFVRKRTVLDSYGRPNPEIRAFLARSKTYQNRKILQHNIVESLRNLPKEPGNTKAYPGRDWDMLFQSTYRHKHQTGSHCAMCEACSRKSDPVCEATLNSTCKELGCDSTWLVPRQRLSQSTENDQSTHQPLVHFGLFATGNVVMKSGEDRDEIAATENVIAFEMEGSGVWETFPCIIIKGVCDYADSHKSKSWQAFAAAIAAACTKELLQSWGSSSLVS
ncbi:hypothetical protein LTR84_008334 [Exophiala bonariae]|uniref:Nucleoside phosphorylase domain-containing protein n=1 Tax=Exophiala bonariae TaxID=1690606 RepID=A0AAV9N0W7_9EURO|nr:hypothetical protein LTR84_008334 [Exophiala bonariae]